MVMNEAPPTGNSGVVTDQEATDQQNLDEEVCPLVRKPTKYVSNTIFYMMAQLGINQADEI
jgi:hypothetical protein